MSCYVTCKSLSGTNHHTQSSSCTWQRKKQAAQPDCNCGSDESCRWRDKRLLQLPRWTAMTVRWILLHLCHTYHQSTGLTQLQALARVSWHSSRCKFRRANATKGRYLLRWSSRKLQQPASNSCLEKKLLLT